MAEHSRHGVLREEKPKDQSGWRVEREEKGQDGARDQTSVRGAPESILYCCMISYPRLSSFQTTKVCYVTRFLRVLNPQCLS